MVSTTPNTLYYGDNLDILRRYVADESVDLVYLDPPFKSNQDYNVLFAEKNGSGSSAQIRAFEDTWHWDQGAELAYREVVEAGGKVSQALQAFRTFLGENDMMAYLAMMAPRLVELRRVLKPTGSIYLHCDPTASHYLKMLMDAVFGPVNFRSEVVWKRTSAHGNASGNFAAVHDLLLFYSRGREATWNRVYQPYSAEYVAEHFVHKDPDGRLFRRVDLRNPSPRPNLVYEFRGYKPHPNGWAVTREKMEQLYQEGRLFFPRKGTAGRIRRKLYLDESPGAPVTDIWEDIRPIHASAAERLGYPTQKPEELLERILKASSNEGDTVLDPFCGCGTTIAVAQRLERRWIGIDITHLAISLMRHRLKDAFGDAAVYQVVGEPTSVPDAETLAADDPYQFQWWALGLVGARPVEGKKGSDKGIDGRLYFHDEGEGGKTKQMVFSVKAGHTSVAHVRDLRGVMEREKAEFGILLCMQKPTRDMKAEAAGAGFYDSPWGKHPKMQILTIEELLGGKKIDGPPMRQANVTVKRAPRASSVSASDDLFETGRRGIKEV